MPTQDEGVKSTKPPAWEAIQEESVQEFSYRNLLFKGWERFGVRHILLWMLGIAFATLVFRSINALGIAITESGESQTWTIFTFMAALRSQRLDLVDLTHSIAAGSILGLGLPTIFSGPANSKFLEHPARVLFALFTSFVMVEMLQKLLVVGAFGQGFQPDHYVSLLGGLSCSFIWTTYAVFRSRVSWRWRMVLVLICVSVAFEFAITLQVFRLTGGSSSNSTRWLSNSVYNNVFWQSALVMVVEGVVLLALMCSGIIELAFGRFKDWRTWAVSFVIPASTLTANAPMIYEMYRAYLMEQR